MIAFTFRETSLWWSVENWLKGGNETSLKATVKNVVLNYREMQKLY